MESELSILRTRFSEARARVKELEASTPPDTDATHAQVAAIQNELEASLAKNAALSTAAAASSERILSLQAQLRAANAAASEYNVLQLRRQVDEANELLVHKQAQLERASGEKAAQAMSLERQLNEVRTIPPEHLTSPRS